jgi:hypothetical protein
MPKPTLRNLQSISKKDSQLGACLSDVQDALHSISDATGVHPQGKAVNSPPPVSGIAVAAADGILHVQLSDGNAPLHKSVQYFVETSTDPSFSQPHVFALGSSRTFRQHVGGASPLHVRGYSQYPGSAASTPIVHPVVVNPGGASGPVWLPSTGSGATSVNGQSGGQGSGTNSLRLGPNGRVPTL